MLLAFSIRNYKSFKNEITFSMTAAPKQKGLDYSLFEKSISGKNYKVLSSAVIYGPNASGKTNLIGAIDVMKEIVMRGHIRNTNDSSLNQAANMLELIPFRGAENIPTLFKIKFIEQGHLIEYGIELQLGTFLDREFERYIHRETLKINDAVVYDRGKDIVINVENIKKEFLNDKIILNIDSAKEIAINGLNPDELFLTNGFKAIFAKEYPTAFQNSAVCINEINVFTVSKGDATRRLPPMELPLFLSKIMTTACQTKIQNATAAARFIHAMLCFLDCLSTSLPSFPFSAS